MIRVSAPGNLFFLGEHAVVYGYPSINVSVNRRTFVTLQERGDDKAIIKSDAFGSVESVICCGLKDVKMEQKELAPAVEVADFFVKEFKICNGFDIDIKSEIPVESGMSSSTAMLSALFKALTDFSGKKIKPDKYFDYLYPFQMRIHGGKASGSEIISSSLGGFSRIQKTEREGKYSVSWKNLGSHEFSVIIGNTKVRAPTALTVGIHIPSLKKRNPCLVDSSFEKIGKLAIAAQSAIKSGNAVKLGSIMNKNQKILSSLMLSHPKLDDCISESLNAGAFGAKLSGGGWGGVMFALVEKNKQADVARAIESTGAEAIITDIGVGGVREES